MYELQKELLSEKEEEQLCYAMERDRVGKLLWV